MAYTSTARNGTDRDVWVRDTRAGTARALVTAGGSWSAMDFSPDGKRLLVMKYVSAAESYPGEVESGHGQAAPVPGGRRQGGVRRLPVRAGWQGRCISFPTSRSKARPASSRRCAITTPDGGALKQLSGDIPWDVDGFEIAEDGRHLAFVSNEDGIDKLHVLALPSHAPVALPELPIGVIGGFGFSPDGKRLALSLNTATSPNDVHVIDLASARADAAGRAVKSAGWMPRASLRRRWCAFPLSIKSMAA